MGLLGNSCKIAAIFIGTFVGAGFASGQEILQYFAVYGEKGLFGAIISGIIFFGFCYCSMYSCRALGGEEYLRQVNFTPALKYVFSAFMLMMFCTMVTACGEMFKSVAGLPKLVGSSAMLAVSIASLMFGGNGLVRLNAVATPVILAGILAVCAAGIYENTLPVLACGGYVGSSAIYIAYNTITLSSVATGISGLIDSKKTVLISSLLCGVVLTMLIVCEWAALFRLPASASEIPILDSVSMGMRTVYFPILFFAMLTTAVSNGFGVLTSVKNKKIAFALLCTAAAAFTAVKFSFIVKYLYRIFGYAGIAVLLNNLLIFVKVRKTEKLREKHKNAQKI